MVAYHVREMLRPFWPGLGIYAGREGRAWVYGGSVGGQPHGVSRRQDSRCGRNEPPERVCSAPSGNRLTTNLFFGHEPAVLFVTLRFLLEKLLD
jgi:hypothetical protein